MLKREVWGCKPLDLLGLGARQLIHMHLSVPLRESRSWQPVLSRGETGRVLETKGFGSCKEHPPKSLSRASSHEQWAHLVRPCAVMAVALFGKPWEPDLARAQSRVDAKNLLKVDPAACYSEANRSKVGGKFALF